MGIVISLSIEVRSMQDELCPGLSSSRNAFQAVAEVLFGGGDVQNKKRAEKLGPFRVVFAGQALIPASSAEGVGGTDTDSSGKCHSKWPLSDPPGQTQRNGY